MQSYTGRSSINSFVMIDVKIEAERTKPDFIFAKFFV